LIDVLSEGDFRRLVRWAKTVGAKVVFDLEGFKFRLVIDKFIHAEDKSGREVPWREAFGSILPWDLPSRFRVREVRVKLGSSEVVFDMEGFKKYLSKLK